MINEWEDYYKILQVHFMAEPEIIKSAYIRLSKKYHPDVNNSPNAEKKMQKINEAYDTLKDPSLRAQYLIKWMEKYSAFNSTKKDSTQIHQLDFAVEPSKKVLLAYLNCIAKKEYSEAFEFLSDKDKESISQNDFIKWQYLVSEVFELISFQCSLKNIYKDILVNDNVFEIIVELQVQVVEKNELMGRHEEDIFCKNVVFENNQWRIFLGYKEITSFIQKFNQLASLKKIKNKKDGLTSKKLSFALKQGIYNKNEFMLNSTKEQLRFNRYGNKFSIIKCTVSMNSLDSLLKRTSIIKIGKIINSITRDLDVVCKWSDITFVILLPETTENQAWIVVNKLKWILKKDYPKYKFEFLAIEQKNPSIQHIMDNLSLIY
ncbi:DnaJ domain-containing protein [Clostridium grantii]|uniref:DnaJ domain-containing protein n=1 Tax=Clostridium grantii DSM 8605 TaxID=1121316 RepID=A0A1M5W5T8_9CLOT|nr:DnaJ domain-containing protein [Clostridium grantii]SHH82959.1 DnaJ domain-containing protein [Clostridium grantii DSM 8605]